ncbi:MAG: UDP-glucose 4-epimerase [bacterium ADurb.Bin400]|nr:MAG: UDP-glucose 4-epimerase [bacterium ADurb.Bin400]
MKKAIFLSTDKAAYPVNAMGETKALMEKVVIARSRQLLPGDTVLCLTRYGNVMASRGSVIPLFYEQAKANKPLTVTNPNMTRFIMTLEEAVELVMYAFEHGNQGDLFVQKAPAVSVGDLAKAVIQAAGSSSQIESIGTRHGEKLYETLVTSEEMVRASDEGSFYRVSADDRDLNYENYVEKGNAKIAKASAYTSESTKQLTVGDMVKELRKLSLFKEDK